MTRQSETEVAVVGGGPAGLAAATRAAESGVQVSLIDSGVHPGGQIWRRDQSHGFPRAARDWIDRFQRSGARWIGSSTVIDVCGERELRVNGPHGGYGLRAKAVIIATGARELFLPFPGWTRVNVMGAGGAQALLKGGLGVRGKRVVISGSGPLLLPVAAAMRRAGATIACVAEQSPLGALMRFGAGLWRQPGKMILAGRYGAAIPVGKYRPGTWVARADGREGVKAATLTDGRREWSERCDILCCSYGLVPATELAQLIGCEVIGGRVTVDECQRTSIPGVFAAGELTGIAGDDSALVEGEIAGLTAAGRVEEASGTRIQRRRALGVAFRDRLERAFAPREETLRLATPETILCRCEDVRLGQVDRNWSSRQAKLYTRMGMGPCQGAVCGGAGERIFGWEPGKVRPPLFAPDLASWLDSTSSNR